MPAGNTYEAIATTTLGSATATVTFGSIPSTYTDLVLVVDGQATGGQRNLLLQFNGDTGANYSSTILYGDSSGANSVRQTSQTAANVGGIDTTSQSNTIAHIMNYSNSTTYKTIIGRGNSASIIVAAKVALWQNTSAITSIVASLAASDTFFTGCTFSLYGIKAA